MIQVDSRVAVFGPGKERQKGRRWKLMDCRQKKTPVKKRGHFLKLRNRFLLFYLYLKVKYLLYDYS